MDKAELSLFKNGHWTWDWKHNKLHFVPKDAPTESTSKLEIVETKEKAKVSKPIPQAPHEIRFKDTYDGMDLIRFRRYFQRKCKPSEPEVITIQDIKDVVLYSTNPKDLTPEFIAYFHMPTMDRFLRALIIYFQYYIQVWERMLARREEAKRKLRQPIVEVLEMLISKELSDLRSMVAREYTAIILGVDDALNFHHMKKTDNMSLDDKDRRIFETMMGVAVRVIWVALQRKNISLIELEMNRLLRTEIFNIVAHRTKRITTLDRNPIENRMLNGKADIIESKLLQRSSLAKEMIFGTHDHRMLGIGLAQFQPIDSRNDYLEITYSAPEEELVNLGITIGLLGVPRHEFDALLVARERTSRNFNIPITELLDFEPPPVQIHPDEKLASTYPKEPPRFVENPQTIRGRKQQKKLWYNYISRQNL